MFWTAVIGRVREIDAMRYYDNERSQSPLNRSAPLTANPRLTGPVAAAAFPSAHRTPATFYQAPRQRDFFHETAAHPDYGRRGLPRYDSGDLGRRQYVSKFTVPPRY